jgi:hypothetical protein
MSKLDWIEKHWSSSELAEARASLEEHVSMLWPSNSGPV